MIAFFRKVLLLLGITSIGVAIALAGILQGWHIQKYAPDELASLLAPHFRVFTPQGAGPFPTVVGFHGCSGINQGITDWMQYLADMGYAGVLVDSLAIREVEPEDVCSGWLLWGSERSGDLVAALDTIKTLPFVDQENIVLMGWSHGGWTIMDTLALNPPQRLPTNLNHAPSGLLQGVKAAVLMYPYCGFPAESRGRGWEQDIPTLLIMAGRDTVVPTSACVDIADILAGRQKPIARHIYPEMGHAFDLHAKKGVNRLLEEAERDATSDARQRVSKFLAAALGSS